jgi:hypothetical protein
MMAMVNPTKGFIAQDSGRVMGFELKGTKLSPKPLHFEKGN